MGKVQAFFAVISVQIETVVIPIIREVFKTVFLVLATAYLLHVVRVNVLGVDFKTVDAVVEKLLALDVRTVLAVFLGIYVYDRFRKK